MVDILPPRLIAERAAKEVARFDRDISQIQSAARKHGLTNRPQTIDALDAASKERGFWNSVRMMAERAAKET